MKLFTKSLLVKIIVLMLIGELLALFAVITLSSTWIEKRGAEQVQMVAQPIQTLINISLAPALFAEDYAAAKHRLDEILSNTPVVTYLWIDDMDDRLVAQGGSVPSQLKEPQNSTNLEHAIGQGILHSDIDIKLGSLRVGHAHLGIDLHNLQAHKRALTRNQIITGLISTLIVTLVLGLFTWLAIRHLRQLDVGARRIAEGNLNETINIDTQDELGRLAGRFNEMAAALQRRRLEQQQEAFRLRAIADYTFAWEIWISEDGKLLWTNPSAERITGYSAQELRMMSDFPAPLFPRSALHPDTGWQQLQEREHGDGLICQLRRKDGTERSVAVYWQPIRDDDGLPLGKRASFIDVSERQQMERDLQTSIEDLRHSEGRQHELAMTSQRQQARFRALLSAMNLGILFETPDRRVEYVNPAFEEMWALDTETELVGCPVDEVLERSSHIFARPSNSSRYVLHVEHTHETSEQFEIQLADGRLLTQVSYPVHDDDARVIGRLWLYEDVTHERQTAEQLIYLAERDSLTGLFNRHRFQLEMERMVSIGQRYNHSFALLYFDLDEFKYINDTYGHREGDTVLTRIAGELSQVVRRNDVFARLGGDEFAILSLIEEDQDEITQLAHRVVTSVAQIPFRFQGQSIRMTTSVGIAIYPDMTNDPDTLVAQADAAMYQAKSQGKNTWSLYDQQRDTTTTMMAQMTWSQRIEHGLEHDLFEIHFQGIYQVRGRKLGHLEALVRLRDADSADKLYMPGQFIPIAEKTGKILAIDQWVLHRVIRMLGEHADMPPVAVNISGRSFDDPSLPQRIRQWLLDYEVAPERLLIELTETAAVSDIQDAQRFIEALHQTGCPVCLDDFGAGFSSFAYLKHITADVLKIDGQFIHDLPNNPENQIFLRAMLDVAKGLKKTTVAEFVDNEAVLEMLEDFGVDFAQGYHLDKPQLNHPALPEALREIAPSDT